MAKEKTTQLKKVTAAKIDLTHAKAGFEFEGVYKGTFLGDPFVKPNDKGELITKQITHIAFEKDGERLVGMADKGLLGALKDAMIKDGDFIKLVKLEKTSISGGRSMNQWDIYA